jgi:very-short-patch-repair endonuclease
MRAPALTIARARELRQRMSPPEVIVWEMLRANRLDGIRFRRQHPIGPYILDFYCSAAQLAVEVDGAGHDIAERVQRDERREAWLAERGIRVLRITARDVLDVRMRQYVYSTILAAVRGD